MAYDLGDTVRAAAHITVGGTDTDPTTLTVYVKNPAGTTTTYLYGTDAQVVKDSVGDYHIDVSIPSAEASAGDWRVRFVGTGAAAGAQETTFNVSPSLVVV